MSGPWEKYNSPTEGSSGPWNNYKSKPETKINPTKSIGQRIASTIAPYTKAPLEYGGMTLGSLIGAGGGTLVEPGGGSVAGGIAGAGLGYSIGKRLQSGLEQYAGEKPPQTMGQALTESGKDILSGSTMEMGGQAAGKAIETLAKPIGSAAKSFIGRFTGTGRVAANEAVESGKSTGLFGKIALKNLKTLKGIKDIPQNIYDGAFKAITDFDKALRGDLSGEKIVKNAKDALKSMISDMESQYSANMAIAGKDAIPDNVPATVAQINRSISNYAASKGLDPKDFIISTDDYIKMNNKIDLNPLKKTAERMAKDFGVKMTPGEDGEITYNLSRSPVGKKGANDIKEILQKINSWGSQPGDDTVFGLDTLKRQIDDFYSESSKARAFVGKLRNAVKDAIVDKSKPYAKAMDLYSSDKNLIKDIESGLMLRKKGMSGRMVADQTLRRLMSAVKDNFELRNQLVKTLTAKGGQDIAGQVAGYSMSQLLPRGLSGSGAVMGAELFTMFKFINPYYWPLLAASSPRISGEILRMIGKTLAETQGTAPLVGRTMAYVANKLGQSDQAKEYMNQKWKTIGQ